MINFDKLIEAYLQQERYDKYFTAETLNLNRYVDSILGQLYEPDQSVTRDFFQNSFKGKKGALSPIILLESLIKDGYVLKTNNEKHYYLTLKGITFVESGGFTMNYVKNITEKVEELDRIQKQVDFHETTARLNKLKQKTFWPITAVSFVFSVVAILKAFGII